MTIKIVVFDVDGTILQTFSWQYIHQNLNTWTQARNYYNKFFSNQINYEEWAQLDANLWKNQPLTRINQIIDQMPYTKGAKETIATLKGEGIKIFLLSAGLTRVAKKVQKETNADGYLANTLGVRNGVLTGKVEVNVSFNDKDKYLPTILKKFGFSSHECAAVGDDLTLIPLFKKVKLAIAFNATDENVEKHAHITIKSHDLRHVLPHILNDAKA